MSYKHYIIYPEEWKKLNVIKQNIDNYIIFVHGGTFYKLNPRESYYEVLIAHNMKYKIYNERIANDKLTPNSVMLLGLFETLNKIPNKQKVIIIVGTTLGFSMAINKEKGVNFDYVYAVLNMIEHKGHEAIIYSFIESTDELVDVIRNPEKYKLHQSE